MQSQTQRIRKRNINLPAHQTPCKEEDEKRKITRSIHIKGKEKGYMGESEDARWKMKQTRQVKTIGYCKQTRQPATKHKTQPNQHRAAHILRSERSCWSYRSIAAWSVTCSLSLTAKSTAESGSPAAIIASTPKTIGNEVSEIDRQTATKQKAPPLTGVGAAPTLGSKCSPYSIKNRSTSAWSLAWPWLREGRVRPFAILGMSHSYD